MTEPVSLDELKAYLRLDASETDEDSVLGSMLTAARRTIERRTNRVVVGADRQLVLDAFPHRATWLMPLEARGREQFYIAIDDAAITGITSIAYLDDAGQQQTLDPSTYTFDIVNAPARVAPVAQWPVAARRPGAVTVAYSVSDLSADDYDVVRQAMLLLCGHWYRNKEAVAVDVRGAPIELPLSVTWLLDPLQKWPTE